MNLTDIDGFEDIRGGLNPDNLMTPEEYYHYFMDLVTPVVNDTWLNPVVVPEIKAGFLDWVHLVTMAQALGRPHDGAKCWKYLLLEAYSITGLEHIMVGASPESEKNTIAKKQQQYREDPFDDKYGSLKRLLAVHEKKRIRRDVQRREGPPGLARLGEWT